TALCESALKRAKPAALPVPLRRPNHGRRRHRTTPEGAADLPIRRRVGSQEPRTPSCTPRKCRNQGVSMRVAAIGRPALVLGLGAVLAGSLLAGCGKSSSGSGTSNEKITLTVNLFGDFGYKDLYAQYQQAHPNIT